MTTTVHNIRRERIFGQHRDDVYIGRAGLGQSGLFGNPVRVGRRCPSCDLTHEAPGDTLPCYERYLTRRLATDDAFRRAVVGLRGKRLWCFCKPGLCHGDVLARRCERLVTVDFRGCLSSEPCRCERGFHTQCRACYNGFERACDCAPCLARRGGRPYDFSTEDDDYPSETEILGVVGDR